MKKNNAMYSVEYIWLDGYSPTQTLRSKTRVVTRSPEQDTGRINLRNVPQWSFDGSSTAQANTGNSDLTLNPVHLVSAPKDLGVDFLVMCEVLNSDGSPHVTNYRNRLEERYREFKALEPRVGFEQEYFIKLSGSNRIIGWPETESPRPQGDYYCGVGANNVSGRSIALKHLGMCIEAGININGINAEVALGQWEFQIGGVSVDALKACDELWIARYILQRVAEISCCDIELDPKPVSGDWNGSGMHTNFSTSIMRQEGGIDEVERFSEDMGRQSMIEMAKENYGPGLERRLTGLHETESIDNFSVGRMNRGCSIRVPLQVVENSRGYLEDRRPNSNADPYRVLSVLVSNL